MFLVLVQVLWVKGAGSDSGYPFLNTYTWPDTIIYMLIFNFLLTLSLHRKTFITNKYHQLLITQKYLCNVYLDEGRDEFF